MSVAHQLEGIANARARQVLSFITAGSVDDGKSTLIGRLLYESKAILGDQLHAITRAKHQRAPSGKIDLSLLTDGLEAEREQGITIDVAYRYFATAKRKFIIADTPGHEQYTRNMVTGASHADAAVVLVDASRAWSAQAGVTLARQTRRHAAVVALLGIKHVALAVNKLDAQGFAQRAFDDVRAAFQTVARDLGVPQTCALPISALEGDNVAARSVRTPWYDGPTLLEWLESVPVEEARHDHAFRMAVQWVVRVHGDGNTAFRGYAGRIAVGEIRVGDTVVVAPSGRRSTIESIHVGESSRAFAAAGQSVTLTLADDIDVARGDWLTAEPFAPSSDRFQADLCWLDRDSLDPARKYWLKHGTRTVAAKIVGVRDRLDLDTLTRVASDTPLANNDIGRAELRVQRPLPVRAFDDEPMLGRFVLIDAANHRTAAAGLIRHA